MENKFSFFNSPISNVKPNGEKTILDVFKMIASPLLSQETYEIQKLYEDGLFLQQAIITAFNNIEDDENKKSKDSKKRLLNDICAKYRDKFTELKATKLPYVTFSVICDKRSGENVKSFSGLLCYDFDKLSNVFGAFYEIITKTTPALVFVSPSGAGIKAIYEVDKQQEIEDIKNFKTYYEHLYVDKLSELKSALSSELIASIDSTSCDIVRACFLCYSSLYYIAPSYLC